MKKLFLTLAAVAAMTFSACQSGEKKAADEGADLKAKIENCTDPDSLKILVAQAQAYAEKLVSEGKDTEAAAYLNEVTPIIDQKDPSVKDAFHKLGQDAEDAIDAAADSVGSTVKSAADKVTDAAGDAVDAAKNAGSKAVDAAGNAVDAAKQKGSDLVSEGADKVKDVFKK